MTAEFIKAEQEDLKSYPKMPSPRTAECENYIRHKLKLFDLGMKTYARRRYARLSFDKYIWANKMNDAMAEFITKNEPSLVALGAAEMSPDSPIGIKKGKRAPGTRHLENSIKKLGHSDVLRVNEDYTSQHCGDCHRKFPKNIYRNRFKVCVNCPRFCEQCKHDGMYEHLPLPKLIVSKKSRRRKRFQRIVERMLTNDIIGAAEVKGEFVAGRLASTKMYFVKKWPLNPDDELKKAADAAGEVLYVIDGTTEEYTKLEREYLRVMARPFSIVWHRDIVASRCIWYRGKKEKKSSIFFCISFIRFVSFDLALCMLHNLPLHESFKRPPRPQPVRRTRVEVLAPRRQANVQ